MPANGREKFMRAPSLKKQSSFITHRALYETPKIVNRTLIVPPAFENDRKSVARGSIKNIQLSPTLSIHAVDLLEEEDIQIDGQLHPAFSVMIVLQGNAHAVLDGTPYIIQADQGPQGYAHMVNETLPWRRLFRKNNRIRKVKISITRDSLLKELNESTLDDHICHRLRSFLEASQVRAQWVPSARAIALAEQILQMEKGSPYLSKLHKESWAVEILCEAFEALTGDVTDKKPLSAHQKAHDIRCYIDRHIKDPLTLQSIAIAQALGVATVQRLFKEAYDITVMEYVRRRRLELAKEAMDHQGLTISQAAYQAGYNSPANFATAFRRVYGFSPSALK